MPAVLSEILKLITITLIPILELRASIPYGIFKTDLSITAVFVICILANIMVGPLVYFFLHYLIHFFLKIKAVDRFYQRTVLRTQVKVHKYVEKYGVLGLAIFISIPLPGSGVYTGALAAYLLGFRFRDMLIAAIIGALIAGVVVLLVCLVGNSAFEFLIRRV